MVSVSFDISDMVLYGVKKISYPALIARDPTYSWLTSSISPQLIRELDHRQEQDVTPINTFPVNRFRNSALMIGMHAVYIIKRKLRN